MKRPFLFSILFLFCVFTSVSHAWWLWDDASPATGDEVTGGGGETIPAAEQLVAVDSDHQPLSSDAVSAEVNRTQAAASEPADEEMIGVPDIGTNMFAASAVDEEQRRQIREKMEEVIAAHESHLGGGAEKHVDDDGGHNPEYDHQVGEDDCEIFCNSMVKFLMFESKITSIIYKYNKGGLS
jgi:hypothetical protein